MFDIAWMEGEQMLVRWIKTDYHQNSVALLMGHFYIQVLNSNVFTYIPVIDFSILIFIGYLYVVSLLAIDANVLRGKFASTNQEELPRSG